MVQILFTVFGMGHIYENAKIIDNHGTLLHTTVFIILIEVHHEYHDKPNSYMVY